jgi:hypothetical protein
VVLYKGCCIKIRKHELAPGLSGIRTSQNFPSMTFVNKSKKTWKG